MMCKNETIIHLIFERYLIVMTFERIDDTTLRCILTEEDLEERGFGLSDFLKNPYTTYVQNYWKAW